MRQSFSRLNTSVFVNCILQWRSAGPCRPLATGQTPPPGRLLGRGRFRMLLFGFLCSLSRDPGCIPRCCVLQCTLGDLVCHDAVYVPGYCVSGHAIWVVCPVSHDAAPGTVQAVFLVGRTRFDRLAFEGFALLEVVGHSRS
jgi:hypothetical protein